MKNLALIQILLALMIFFNSNKIVNSQSLNFLWAVKAGGSSWDRGHKVATDSNDDIITIGQFNNSSVIGDTVLVGGGTDIFIVKYDSEGDFLWVRQAGGGGNDFCADVTVDGSDNVILTGFFDTPFTIGDTVITPMRGWQEDIFIAKYDTDGNFLWVETAGGSDQDRGHSVATDYLGNIIVTGVFSGSATFADTVLVVNGETGNIFIAKYDSEGSFLWAKSIGGSEYTVSNGITTDYSGNIIITGLYSGNVMFDDTLFVSKGQYDILIVKYNSEGDYLWARDAGGYLYDAGMRVVTDNFNNIIITGYFIGYSTTFCDTTIYGVDFQDIFIAKYDTDGNFLWVQMAGGEGDDYSNDLATDNFDNIIVTGSFKEALYLEDSFIAKYDTDGNFLWSQLADGTEYVTGRGISTDILNNIIVIGYFTESASFGDTVLISSGQTDIFIVKIKDEEITDVNHNPFVMPKTILKYQNSPNPFTTSTTIEYELKQPETVRITFYNQFGKQMNIIEEHQSQGLQKVIWTPDNLADGIYYFRLQAGDQEASGKMVRMK